MESVWSDLQSDRLQQVSAFYLLGRSTNPYAHSDKITNPAEQGQLMGDFNDEIFIEQGGIFIMDINSSIENIGDSTLY